MKRLLMLLFLLMPFTVQAAETPVLSASQLASMLDQNRGKVIMLNFFATWCPPCRVEMPELVELRKIYPDSSLLIVGLSVDEDAAAVPPFIESAHVNYPVYIVGRDVTDLYGITSVPHNTFYARDGQMAISEPGAAVMSAFKEVVDKLQEQN